MTNAIDIDLVQATILRAFFENNMHNNQGTMEVFTRRMPYCRDFFVVAGIGRIIDFLANTKFSDNDIRILRSIPALQVPEGPEGDKFCNYLKSIDFAKELKVQTIPEGSVAFANEPLVRIDGPVALTQYVEKRVLSIINHDVRVASKAARIVLAANGRPVWEFGGRRAHEDTTADTARAAYIAGFAGTSSVQGYAEYGIPVAGTMGHVWIMAHEVEDEAYANWSKVYKDSMYLPDTYDSYNGTDKAIKAAGNNLGGIRLDSGDLYQESISAKRRLLKSNSGQRVMATNDLDEYSIADLLERGATIDAFGVGTQLVSTPDTPSLGFVKKLSSIAYAPGAEQHPICKIADGGKGTWPARKQIWRNFVQYGNEVVFTNDIVALDSEEQPSPLAVPVLVEQPIVTADPNQVMVEARVRCAKTLASLPPYMKVIPKQPNASRNMEYPISFSDKLSQLRQEIRTNRK